MPKPKFDPNLHSEEHKPSFDPSLPEDAQDDSAGQIGAGLKKNKLVQFLSGVLAPVQSAREGFVKGATFGLADSVFPGAEQQSEKSNVNRLASLLGETGASLGQGEIIGGGLVRGAKAIRGGGAKLMEMALGTKPKDLPGIGKVAFEEGLVGTKGMMAKQAQKAASKKSAEIENLVNQLGRGSGDETVQLMSHQPTADAIKAVEQKFLTSTGQPVSGYKEAQPVIDAWSKNITSRAPSTPQEILEFKRATNPLGYSKRTGDPLHSLKAELAQKESEQYGKQLGDAWRQANPDNPEALAELNYQTSRLLKAEKAAKRGQQNDLSSLLVRGVKRLPGAVAGSAVGGPVGGAIGAAIPEEVLLSGAAKYLAKPGAAALETVAPATQLLPLNAQLLRLKNQKEQYQDKPTFDPTLPSE